MSSDEEIFQEVDILDERWVLETTDSMVDKRQVEAFWSVVSTDTKLHESAENANAKSIK